MSVDPQKISQNQSIRKLQMQRFSLNLTAKSITVWRIGVPDAYSVFWVYRFPESAANFFAFQKGIWAA